MANTRRTVSRRRFLGWASMLGATSALAACAPSVQNPAQPTQAGVATVAATPAPGQAATPAPKEVIRLEWWSQWGSTNGEACKKVAANYMAQTPGVEVNVLLQANDEKVLAAVAANEAPDFFNMHENHPAYAMRGALTVLDEYISNSSVIKPDNYDARMFDTLKYCGKFYAVPAPEGDLWFCLVYNKKLFKEAGLDPERPPQTFDELRQMSDAITRFDQNGDIEVLGYDPLDGMSALLPAWCMGWNTVWVDENMAPKVNTREHIEFAQYIAGYYRQYGAEKMGAYRQAYTGWTDPNSGFFKEKQAMMCIGSFMPGETVLKCKPEIYENFGITWWPNKAGKKLQNGTFVGISMFSSCKHKDEGFKFLEYVCSDDALYTLFKEGGVFTFTKSLVKKAQADLEKLPCMPGFVDTFLNCDEFYPFQMHPMTREIWNRWGKAIGEVNFGRMTAEQAMNALQAELDQVFAPMQSKLCPA